MSKVLAMKVSPSIFFSMFGNREYEYKEENGRLTAQVTFDRFGAYTDLTEVKVLKLVTLLCEEGR